MALSTRSRRILSVTLALVAVGGIVTGVWLWQLWSLPRPGSPEYEQYVEVFQQGLVALEIGGKDISVLTIAEDNLDQAVKKIPEEPAGWANRGLFQLRQSILEKDKGPSADQTKVQALFKQAAEDLDKARTLAPNDPGITALLGVLATQRGLLDHKPEQLAQQREQFIQAHELLRKAVEKDPRYVRDLYALAEELGKPGMDHDREYQNVLEEVLEVTPHNLLVLLKLAQTAARRDNAKDVVKRLGQLKNLSEDWSADIRKELADLEKLAAEPKRPNLALLLNRFENLLSHEHAFVVDRNLIATNPKCPKVGTALQTFIRLQPFRPSPAPPDLGVAFIAEPIPEGRLAKEIPNKHWDVALPVWLNVSDPPVILVANSRSVVRAEGQSLSLPFPSGPKEIAPSRHGVVPLDWNNDYRMDLLLAGAGGLTFFEQQQDGSFTNVNNQTRLPKDVLTGDYYGAWAVDVDMDGDIDLIVARRTGEPLLLRNNRNGTFTPKPIFPGVEAARCLAWADLDNDGAADAALVDAEGKLHIFMNERSGHFVRRMKGPELPGKIVALTEGDVNDDGVFDLVVLLIDGELLRISDRDKGLAWDTGTIGRLEPMPDKPTVGEGALAVADLDNNGSLDLVWMGPDKAAVWLSDAQAHYERLPVDRKNKVFGLADFTNSGRLDMLALEDKDSVLRLVNKGSKPYHWLNLRARAEPVVDPQPGDGRINSFAIGGEIQIRNGTFVVKQMINAPVVHFGLGDRKGADVMRFLWPTGAIQGEFNTSPDQTVAVLQRLCGSCPYLFTWDGERMVFVTDFMWSTPLGMYINAQSKGGFLQTTDWVKIRGDQLKPRDGYYDVRVNANLWETHYMDLLSLLVVDHPPGTEMHVDERFFMTPTKPKIYLTEKSRPVARAWDHEGKDATEEVREIDGVYLDRAGRGQFQGVTRDHWVEVDLGDDAPTEGPVYFLAHGYVHPTDSSINFALEQGSHEAPRGLVLEVPDGKGGWKAGLPSLGFPAGKNKTIVIPLDGIEGKKVSRHFRLRTNMEIYWDALHYARGLDSSVCKQTAPELLHAELRFRGILEMTKANISSPELPHYDRVVSQGQPWRDLIGFYTRFGDVRELLARVDDRYVIMNAGDEIVLRFKERPAPREGWRRDFIWISDGWVKDGNLNTRFGKTVLPLPAHDQTSYDRPPGRLEDDPVYQRFPRDWEIYHTRYVTPAEFERGLRSCPGESHRSEKR
jgi:tetratricopeptide (TPR) repeat protein